MVHCPFCMLNSNAPLLDRSINHVLGIEWMSPINLISYPHQYALEQRIYDEGLNQMFERTPFVLCESRNMYFHKNRLALNMKSPLEDVKTYIDKIEFGTTSFETEHELLQHIHEVRI